MRYFRPKSLTWWSGVFLIAMGVLQAAGLPLAWTEGQTGLTGVLKALTGALTAILGGAGDEAAPAALIGLGAGMIGLRDAMLRDRDEARLMQAQIMAATADPYDEIEFGYEDEDEPYQPPGESPLPDGVIDPYGPGGSRG